MHGHYFHSFVGFQLSTLMYTVLVSAGSSLGPTKAADTKFSIKTDGELEGLSHEYYVLVLWFWGILLCPVLFVLRASRGIGGLSNAF
jgi:hypothetical protein